MVAETMKHAKSLKY